MPAIATKVIKPVIRLMLNRLFLLIENRVLAWHYGYTQQRS